MSTNKSNKPELRFKVFYDDWEQRKLSDITNVYDGVHQTPDYQESGIMFLSVENIATLKSNKYISQEAFERDYKNYPEKGDILMTRIGDVGTPNVVETTEKVAFYVSLALLKPKNIDSYFLCNAICSPEFQRNLKNRTLVTAIPQKINKDEIGKVEFLMPQNTAEQKAIGAYFKNLDRLITLHQRKCDNLKIIKKSMLDNLFPKIGEKVPKWRFKGFNNDWEQRKLSDLVDVYSGMDYKHLSIGNIPVFGTGGYMLSVDRALSYDRNAIGIGRKGTIDKPYILKAPFWTVDTLFYCIPRDEGTLNFDYDLFQCIDWKQKDESTGVPSLSKVAINDTDVMVPKTDEQKKIGYFFEELDLVITLHQSEVERLKKAKQFFLDKMFI